MHLSSLLLNLFQALCALATTIIAYAALQSWRSQDKAKKEIEFLDALVDAVHAYTVGMLSAIQLVELVRLNISAYAPVWESGGDNKEIKGAISYIEKNGSSDAERLGAALEAIKGPLTRLVSLTAKGQVFNFKDYARCQQSIDVITVQYDRLEGFATRLALRNSNWKNEEVRGSLKAVLEIDVASLRDGLGESNRAITEFARNAYKKTYG